MRLTKQKKTILSYLKKVKSHPSAETVYKEVKKVLPKISLSTVYRNLDDFAKQGKISVLPGEKRYFDGDISNHHHFICRACGRIIDVKKDFSDLKIFNIKELGKIDKTMVTFYGICQECLK